MRRRIGLQIILGAALATSLTIGLMAVAISRAQRSEVLFELTRSADQLGETIKSSTHDDMLENRRENLRRRIELIGRQAGIKKVRLFNKEGLIAFSSDPAEVGSRVDQKAEACFACHAEGQPLEKVPVGSRARVFDTAAGGGRVLGLISPIQNEAGCASASCHAHAPGQRVLGVLDVTVSLAEADRGIAKSQAQLAALALLAIGAISLVLWWLSRRLVVLPARALVAGARRVSEGDMSTMVPDGASHELGEVARAFNLMTRRLVDVQRQLGQADKLASVGRLAAGVAHEINNPLTGVLTYASLLAKRPGIDASAKEDCDVIIRETKRCREIVRNLLDFARPAPPKRQRIDLNEVARHAVTIVMNQLVLNRAELVLDLADDLPRPEADPGQIEQVLVNLLLNAADAVAEKGGRIRISSRGAGKAAGNAANPQDSVRIGPSGNDASAGSVTRGRGPGPSTPQLSPSAPDSSPLLLTSPSPTTSPAGLRTTGLAAEDIAADPDAPGGQAVRSTGPSGATVALSIEDSGRGIPAEDIPRLFEPFFTTKGAHGTGLGLAVSWAIAEAHGGTIAVESWPESGSRFTLSLPVGPVPSRHGETVSPRRSGMDSDRTNETAGVLSTRIHADASGVAPADPVLKEETYP